MKILALDQSLNVSGWCILENRKLTYYGTFTIKSTLPIEERLHCFWNEISKLYADYQFDVLVFEDTQLQYNTETFRKLCYIESTVLLWCDFNSIKYKIYTPSSWRSLLGKGWGKKREEQKKHAIKIIKNKYNKIVTSDEADAICIGLAYLNDASSESAF